MIVFELEICFEFWFLSVLALNTHVQRCINYNIFFYVCCVLLSQTPVLEDLFGNVHPLPTPFVVSASVLMWLIYYNTGLHFCFKSMSAYHLYGNRVIPQKIQMEQLISILPFPDFTKRTRIFCTICLDYLCQASCWEKWTNLLVFCYWYNSIPFPFSGPKK